MRFLSLCLVMLTAIGASSAALAEGEEKPTLSGAGGAAGIGQYPPSSWGVAGATIRNPTAQDQQLLATFNFEESPTLQFAVDVWVPAHCRRSIWLPIRTNPFEIREQVAVPLLLRQQLFDVRGDQPIMLSEARGQLNATRDRWITGMLADGDESDDDAISAALAMRRASDFSQRLAYLSEGGLPTMPAGWQGLSGLVIAKNVPTLDSAQVQALRQWLLSGGKLWVMADQVEPQAIAALLGETWTLGEVDRIPLSVVNIDSAGGSAKPVATVTLDDELVLSFEGKKIATLPEDDIARVKSLESLRDAIQKKLDESDNPDDRNITVRISGAVPGMAVDDLLQAVRAGRGQDMVERVHEMPVDFVRVFARDFEVVHTIGGWPASMRKPVGKGWLLVTTLGSRGWIEPRLVPQIGNDGAEIKDQQGRTMMTRGHIALRPLRDLADWFHQDRRVQVLPAQSFERFVSEQIGYSIVSRSTVLWTLTFFSLALLGVGFWLSRSGRLEHLAWMGGAMALVVTLVLIIIGKANQTSVPMTVAQAQFVQIAPDQQHSISTGLVSIYNPGSAKSKATTDGEPNATLEADAGGLILPADLSALGSRMVRMVWTDFDRWHWRNVTMSTGASRRATFEHVTPLAKPVRAVVTFDAHGAVGQVTTGDLGAMSNMLIAAPSGALAVRAKGDGSIFATATDALAPGQYMSGGVLDESQRRKQEVLRMLLGDNANEESKSSKATAPAGAAPRSATSASRPPSYTMTGRTRSLPFPEGPTLLGWTDAVPLGFVLPDAELKIGSALVSIPITIERPASGASIVVPSAFLPYRVVRGKYGPTPAVFVEDWRVWNSSSVPGTLPLVFRLPRELLPMRVEKAKFTLDITAPNAGVEIFVDRGGQLSSVDKRQAPDGAYEIQLTGEGLQPDASGDILVIFRVNYLTAGERTLWQVHRTALEVSGVVEPALP